jgi:chaperonin GroES
MAKSAKKSTKSGSKKKTPARSKVGIRPLGEKILLERLEAEEVTKGGIVLPDTAREKPQEGTILAVGEGRMLKNGTRAEPQVKVGQKVLFSSYAGTEIKLEGRTYLLMDETDVLAVIE